jgi:hypothetical protein
MTHWHPLFAKLLRPLLEGHYEVLTNLPVGDTPRSADIVLVRRTKTSAPQFRGIWRWLTAWNILEFKGPSVSARLYDLDLLVELGLGIHRRLQSEGDKQGGTTIGRDEVSFWYLVNQMGKGFLTKAADLLGPLERLDRGIQRVQHLGRAVYLVANREVAVDRDSIPLHLLVKEPEERTRQLARQVAAQPELFAHYGAWLAVLFPALRKEIRAMARKMGIAPLLDLKPLIDELGIKEVVKQIGLKEVINEVGLKEVINEVGIDNLLLQMTEKHKRELLRRLQCADPSASASQ